MKLLFRLVIVIIRSLFFSKKMHFTETGKIFLRVLPNDIDANLHLNNGRFLTMMDLGRIDLTIRSGLHKMIIKERLMPVAASIQVSYVKSLAPLEKFCLETKLLTWDDEWFYIEQKFINNKSLVVASAIVKAVFKKGAKRLNPNDVMEKLEGRVIVAPESPQYLLESIEADKAYFAHIKKTNQKLLKENLSSQP